MDMRNFKMKKYNPILFIFLIIASITYVLVYPIAIILEIVFEKLFFYIKREINKAFIKK